MELAMEEKGPAVAFLPEGVSLQCEDDRETMLRLHLVMDEWGLAHMPPPPPLGENSGGLSPRGTSHPSAEGGC